MREFLAAYVGKRFAGLIVCVGSLLAGYFNGPVETFGTLATTLGIIFGAFVAGQSATDIKEVK